MNGNGSQTWYTRLLLQSPFLAIAVFLIWWMTSTLDARLSLQAQAQAKTEQALTALIQEYQSHRADTAYTVMHFEALIRLTRQVCVNAARTDTARDRCTAQ